MTRNIRRRIEEIEMVGFGVWIMLAIFGCIACGNTVPAMIGLAVLVIMCWKLEGFVKELERADELNKDADKDENTGDELVFEDDEPNLEGDIFADWVRKYGA